MGDEGSEIVTGFSVNGTNKEPRLFIIYLYLKVKIHYVKYHKLTDSINFFFFYLT
jgi:hypothetical protein